MKTLPTSLKKVIEFFEKLPSVGPKTAKRLGFYLLRMPQKDLEEAAQHIATLKKSALYCKRCLNLTEQDLCLICQDTKREASTIAVVEDVLDLLSMEMGDNYQGLYHVLHGRIDPLNYIGPEDIYIEHLLSRVKREREKIREIILATNPNTEGEATALFIKKRLAQIPKTSFKTTRLAYGLPIGADLEYADYMTLKRAMEGRREF